MKKENILIVHNHYIVSGGEDSVVKNEKELLEKKGHKVFLYTRDNNEISDMSKVKKVGMGFSFLFSVKTFLDICHLIVKEKIDVVHVHNTLSLISPSVYYASVLKEVPVIQTIHNFRLICPNALMYRKSEICEKCIKESLYCAVKNRCYHDSFFQTLVCVIGVKLHCWMGIYEKIYYICLTEFNRGKLLEGMGKHINREKIYIKPNFVEDAYSELSKEKRDIKDKYCIYVGRLEEPKGIFELIEVWQKMEDVPLLIICGSGPEEERIKEIAARQNNIICLGRVSHKKVLCLIFYAEALIFSSRLYEGMPMTILESMMCGTPVICKGIGNGADIVKKVKKDMLYSTKDELCDILKKRDYEKYGQYYREAYLTLYSPEVNYSKYQEILKGVKADRR